MKLRFLLSSLVIASLLLSSCQRRRAGDIGEEATTAEYQVYATVLTKLKERSDSRRARESGEHKPVTAADSAALAARERNPSPTPVGPVERFVIAEGTLMQGPGWDERISQVCSSDSARWDYQRDSRQAVPSELCRAFSAVTLQESRLETSRLNTPLTTSVLPDTLRTAIFAGGSAGWQDFYGRFSGADGYLAFSRVAFTEDRRWAMVYLEQHTNAPFYTGTLCVLDKQGETWMIAKAAIFRRS